MKFIRQAAVADILLGIWLLAAPSVIGYQATRPIAVFEDLLPGLFLVVTAGLVLFMKSRAFPIEWLQALCGIWLLVGAIALAFQRLHVAAVNSLVVGVVVFALSLLVWALTSRTTDNVHMHKAG
jgi:hypothetical protein